MKLARSPWVTVSITAPTGERAWRFFDSVAKAEHYADKLRAEQPEVTVVLSYETLRTYRS